MLALLPLVTWFAYWVAFLPGVVNIDVAWQWAQAQGRLRYNDWHPVTHTVLIWSLTRIWNSLGAVSLFNLSIALATFSDCLGVARTLGTPRSVRVVVTLWVALCPAVAFVAIGTWKDAPFAVVVVQLALFVLRYGFGELHGPRPTVRLAALLAAAALLRHNGGAIAAPTICTWWICNKLGPSRRAIGRSVVYATVAVLLIRYATFGLLRPARHPRQLALQTVLHETAGLIAAGTPLSAEDSAVLDRMLPLPEWVARYRCWNGNRLFSVKPTLTVTRSAPVLRAWWHLVSTNPWALWRHWRCVTAFVWNPGRTPLRTGWAGSTTVEPNPYGVEPESVAPLATHTLGRFIRWTLSSRDAVRSICWQPAIPLYVVLGSMMVATWRSGSVLPAVALSPALSNTIFWLIFPFLPHIRFQAPVFLMAPLGIFLAAADWTAMTSRGPWRQPRDRNDTPLRHRSSVGSCTPFVRSGRTPSQPTVAE